MKIEVTRSDTDRGANNQLLTIKKITIMNMRITTNKSDAKFILPTVGFTDNYKAFTTHIAVWNYVLNIEVNY